MDAELEWRDNAGQLIVMARGNPDPILDLPWAVTRQRLTISDGRWNWPYQGFPLSGRLAFNIDNWQAGPDNAQVSGRLNILTQGDAGKANAVLTIGPGKLSMDSSEMPLQLTGEAKQKDLIFYAVLPAMFRGSLADPQLTFAPGALLRSRGRVIDALDIDEIRWPLAGVMRRRAALMADYRLFYGRTKMRWAISFFILMAWRMIFSLMLVAGGGAIGGKEALRQCAPTGILPDRANGMITPSD